MSKKVKLWKVLEGPVAEEDFNLDYSGEDHWLMCMATDSSCGGGQWFEFELCLPNFNSAYEMKKRIDYSIEPVEIDLEDMEEGVC